MSVLTGEVTSPARVGEERPLTLADVESAISASWSLETCDPTDVETWSPGAPSQGQCAVTALVLHDLLGGQLLEAEVHHADGSHQGFHYWNRFAGVDVDLTRRQFQRRRSRAAAAPDGLSAEAVVEVALPHARAAALCSTPAPGGRAGALPRPGQLADRQLPRRAFYDRHVCDEPFAAGVGTPVQYLFDRTAGRLGRPPAASIWLCPCRAPSARWSMTVDELRERYVPALGELLPRARNAKGRAVPRHA